MFPTNDYYSHINNLLHKYLVYSKLHLAFPCRIFLPHIGYPYMMAKYLLKYKCLFPFCPAIRMTTNVFFRLYNHGRLACFLHLLVFMPF